VALMQRVLVNMISARLLLVVFRVRAITDFGNQGQAATAGTQRGERT
jgi:hypothetical protein